MVIHNINAVWPFYEGPVVTRASYGMTSTMATPEVSICCPFSRQFLAYAAKSLLGLSLSGRYQGCLNCGSIRRRSPKEAPYLCRAKARVKPGASRIMVQSQK